MNQTIKGELVTIRLTTKEKKRLKVLAEADNRTLSNYIQTELIKRNSIESKKEIAVWRNLYTQMKQRHAYIYNELSEFRKTQKQ